MGYNCILGYGLDLSYILKIGKCFGFVLLLHSLNVVESFRPLVSHELVFLTLSMVIIVSLFVVVHFLHDLLVVPLQILVLFPQSVHTNPLRLQILLHPLELPFHIGFLISLVVHLLLQVGYLPLVFPLLFILILVDVSHIFLH